MKRITPEISVNEEENTDGELSQQTGASDCLCLSQGSLDTVHYQYPIS